MYKAITESDLASCTSCTVQLVLESTKLVLGFSHQKRVVSQPRPLLRANEVREGHTATSDWKIRAGEGSI